MRILAINPGSTSTKIAVYDAESAVLVKTIRHTAAELAVFDKLTDQIDFRKELIETTLAKEQIHLSSLDAIIGRGGLLRPIESGTYKVSAKMLEDLHSGRRGEHASNLGGILAEKIAKSIGKEAYIADPVVVDELSDLARVSGHPLIERVSIFHALNHKAIARMYCAETGKKYEDINIIVVHIGGGISIGAHQKGRVVDVNNALDGDGPFSPERSGSLPTAALVDLCFSGQYDKSTVKKMIQPKGGLVAYFGSNDFKELFERKDADHKISKIIDALLYQISKEIGAASAVLKGDVDAILLTGGLVYNSYVVEYITEHVKFIANVKAYPGEDEMSALAMCALRILRNEAKAKEY